MKEKSSNLENTLLKLLGQSGILFVLHTIPVSQPDTENEDLVSLYNSLASLQDSMNSLPSSLPVVFVQLPLSSHQYSAERLLDNFAYEHNSTYDQLWVRLLVSDVSWTHPANVDPNFAAKVGFMMVQQVASVGKWQSSGLFRLDLHAALAPMSLLDADSLAFVDVSNAQSLKKTLQTIVGNILGLVDPPTNKNFFGMGGSSLAVVNLLAKIHKLYRVAVPVELFVAEPTIEKLVDLVTEQQQQLAMEELDDEKKGKEVAEGGAMANVFPLSSAQERIWFMEQMAPGVYHVPSLFTIHNSLSPETLEWRFNLLISRHQMFRAFFPDDQGVPRMEIVPDAELKFKVLPYPTGGTEQENKEKLRVEIATHIQESFDIKRAPLLRVVMFTCSVAAGGGKQAPQNLLLVVAHHLVLDGFSSFILYKEIGALLNPAQILRVDKLAESQYVSFFYFYSLYLLTLTGLLDSNSLTSFCGNKKCYQAKGLWTAEWNTGEKTSMECPISLSTLIFPAPSNNHSKEDEFRSSSPPPRSPPSPPSLLNIIRRSS